MESRPRQPISPEEIVVETTKKPFSRRAVLKFGGLGLASLATLGALEAVSFIPKRMAHAAAASTNFPDIQFDIGNFIAPVQTFNGIPFHFGPVYTLFATTRLTRTPSKSDQQVLANALNTIEANYTFSPSGVFVFVAYGLPYFNRLPQSLVASHMPRLLTDNSRFPLEEAVPSPTDVLDANNPQPPRKKEKFNVAVQIESNDVLFSIRSDNLFNLFDVSAWFEGSNVLNGSFVPSPDFDGLFNFTSTRLMFVQIGLPRKIANAAGLPFASEINPNSPMWGGFADQHVNAAGPGPILTFAGNSSAHLTTTQPGDYFDNASIQHLSHNINDLDQFYRKVPLTPSADPETFTERLQYMFSSPPGSLDPNHPNLGNAADAFTDGGANIPASLSAFIPNTFHGSNAVLTNFDPDDLANGIKTLRGGHEMGLQRSSRAPDGTPLHARMDGPGFDSIDVPDGSTQPKLHFSAFFPTADFFQKMRANVAMIDLLSKADGGTEANVPAGVNPIAMKDNGLERFITATRRQNFLIPPRRHRAFPLVELT